MKSKKVLKVLYVLLAVAVGVTVFCFCMATFGGNGAEKESETVHSETGENGQEMEEGLANPADSAVSGDETGSLEAGESQGMSQEKTSSLFDGYVKGSNMLKTEKIDINGVKTIVYFLDNYEKKPIVILQHGLTSKKEDMKDLAGAIANLGYVVITPDAAGHGELKSKEKVSVIEMVGQTAHNFETVIEYFQGSAYADVERMGLVGFSLGGLASFSYAGNGSYNPRVVVSLCSTPAFEDLIGEDAAYEFYKNGKISITKKKEERGALEEEIKSKSPYEKLLADTDTYFFMLCGDADDVVPHEGNIRFYEAMKDTSKDIKLIVKENQKHEITEEDLMQVLEYLKGHL